MNYPRVGSLTAKVATVVLVAGALVACGSVDRTGRAFWQPYRPNVQQGNWITQQQIALLRPGMSREQVRFALGTPTLTPVFHADRWEYPYFLKPGYGETQERRFTVYFENDVLARWEGDEQPRVQPFQDPNQAQVDTLGPLQGPAGAPVAPNSSLPIAPGQPGSPGSEPAQQAGEQRGGNSPIQLQNRPGSADAPGGLNPNTGSVPLR